MRDVRIKRSVNLLIGGGAASVAFPIGPALAQFNVKAAEFAKAFNDVTGEWKEFEFPVTVIIYKTNDFDFIVKMPQITHLIDCLKKPLREGSEEYSIKRTDIYNIAKLKACFNYQLLRPLVIMILNLVESLKIEIIND
jgi:ribosomal protein L11